MTDLEVIDLVLKGRTDCFSYLVDRYSKLSFAVAYRIVKDTADSQDVVQDAFIAAYENLRDFKGESKFSTWLYRIVTNKALTLKNKQRFFEEVDEYGQLDVEYNEELELANEKFVREALNMLHDKDRLILELFYYQDQSIKEISQVLQLTEANVKVMLHRARKKMNDFIQNSIKFVTNE